MRTLGAENVRVRVLDLCCGAGRHAEALAAMGFDVVGIDLSSELLELAACRDGVAGRVVRADVRALPFGPEFGLVLNLFTSFGYFADDAENEGSLREMARVLTPGGTLVIDHMNRERVERTLTPEDTRTVGDFEVHSRRRIRGDRIVKDMRIVGQDGQERRLTEDVRLYRPTEMASLLRRAGLVEVELYGSFDGDVLTADSDRMIAVAAKPAAGEARG